jgi:hypothetical protein
MLHFNLYSKQWLTLWLVCWSRSIHPKLTLFHAGYVFIIASTVWTYSVRTILILEVLDGCSYASSNSWYDRCSSIFDLAFLWIWAKINPNMKSRFHLSWWSLEGSKSLATCPAYCVCCFIHFGSTSMSDLIFSPNDLMWFLEFHDCSEWSQQLHWPSHQSIE